MSNIQKLAARIPAAVAIGSMLFKLVAGSAAYSQATLAPEPGTGHVVPILAHGRTLYLTQDQIELTSPSHWSSVVLFVSLAVAVLVVVGRDHSRRTRAGPGAQP